MAILRTLSSEEMMEDIRQTRAWYPYQISIAQTDYLIKRVEELEKEELESTKVLINTRNLASDCLYNMMIRAEKAEADVYFEHHNTAGLNSICNNALASKDKAEADLAKFKEDLIDHLDTDPVCKCSTCKWVRELK